MNTFASHKTGWIEVICGSMFSGKTEELIRRLKRAQIARQKLQCFKPTIDDRYSRDHIASHDSSKILSRPVEKAAQILELVDDNTRVVGIDEGQFFDEALVDVCQKLANRGIRVVVAGLDMDYLGRPFEPMPRLLAVAEYVTKLSAVCMVCGSPAARTQRKSVPFESSQGEGRVVVGSRELYEARCRGCHDTSDHQEILNFAQTTEVNA